MTLKDFIKQATEEYGWGASFFNHETFEQLIRADEREACAKVCDELIAPDIYSDTDVSMWDVTCMECATAIRARGQA